MIYNSVYFSVTVLAHLLIWCHLLDQYNDNILTVWKEIILKQMLIKVKAINVAS